MRRRIPVSRNRSSAAGLAYIKIFWSRGSRHRQAQIGLRIVLTGITLEDGTTWRREAIDHAGEFLVLRTNEIRLLLSEDEGGT